MEISTAESRPKGQATVWRNERDHQSMLLIIMGVSGCGKTTIGTLVAEQVGAVFADADAYHSDACKRKMSEGVALDDADRAPWLRELNIVLRSWSDQGASGVLACSCLKASYRFILLEGISAQQVRVIWLDGSREVIGRRLATRKNHFMNAGLLESQYTALEPPVDAQRITNDGIPTETVTEIVRLLGLD